MNKLYLLPISLLLLNPGYATEEAASLDPSEFKIEATSYSAETSVLENLENDISAMLEETSLVSYDETKQPIKRLNQQKVKKPVAPVVEEETADAAEEYEKPPQKNVRRYTQRRTAPKVQVEQPETADAEEDAYEQPVTRSEQRYAERRKAAKAQAQTETVDAEEYEQPVQKTVKRQAAPKAQAEQAEAMNVEEEQSVEKVQPRTRRSQSRKAPAKAALAEQADEAIEQDYEEPVQQKKVPPKLQPRTPRAATQKRMNKSSTAQVGSQSSRTAQATGQKKRVAQNNDNNGQMDVTASKKKQMMYNTAARPTVTNGYNFFLMGDVLLWQAAEENLTYAYTGNTAKNSRNFHTVDFAWDWGFRLGAGYNAPRDGWDIDLYWTHIRNNASASKHANSTSSLFQVFGDANAPFPGTPTSASGHWKVHLDQVDLELGREFFVGKHLTVRPFVGMRSAWIFQKYKIQMSDDLVQQRDNLKNRYWGFGFMAGMNTDWELGWDFSIYGNADMAVLFGFFDVNQNGTQDSSRIWSQSKSFRTGRAIVDLGMGLKWNRLFCGDRFGLTLKAGYEYHLYFDQNQFLVTNGNTNFETFNPAQGDLTYQGVIGSIQFDF